MLGPNVTVAIRKRCSMEWRPTHAMENVQVRHRWYHIFRWQEKSHRSRSAQVTPRIGVLLLLKNLVDGGMSQVWGISMWLSFLPSASTTASPNALYWMGAIRKCNGLQGRKIARTQLQEMISIKADDTTKLEQHTWTRIWAHWDQQLQRLISNLQWGPWVI